MTTNQRKKNCGCVVDITYAGTQILHKHYELSEGKGRNNLISCCCIFRNAYSFIPSMQSRWCNKYLDCQYRREKLTTISKYIYFLLICIYPWFALFWSFRGLASIGTMRSCWTNINFWWSHYQHTSNNSFCSYISMYIYKWRPKKKNNFSSQSKVNRIGES